MVEMIFAFSIFLIIVSLFPLGLTFLLGNDQVDEKMKRMEWHVFVNQLKKEIRLSEDLTVFDQRMILKKQGQTILYEGYGQNLRRRVDSKGHEIVFQGVKAFEFSRIQDGVQLTLTDHFNQRFQISLYSLIGLE